MTPTCCWNACLLYFLYSGLIVIYLHVGDSIAALPPAHMSPQYLNVLNGSYVKWPFLYVPLRLLPKRQSLILEVHAAVRGCGATAIPNLEAVTAVSNSGGTVVLYIKHM